VFTHLKQWWTLHAAWIIGVLYWFVPSIQASINKHPKSAFAGIAALLLSALYTKAPGATKVISVAILAMLFSCPAQAQTNVVPPPVHFTLSGSASSFSGTNGTSAASLAGAGINVTPHFSAGYLQVNIPAISGRFEMGVVNYTRTLHDIIGNTLASKIQFDTTGINVTFQGGGGKLLQPIVNRIAETAGVYFTYPVTNNMSLQLLGISVFHGGTQTGFVTVNTTTAVSTGLQFNF
jgi:hypothetical protein